jgi:hypothetical protein
MTMLVLGLKIETVCPSESLAYSPATNPQGVTTQKINIVNTTQLTFVKLARCDFFEVETQCKTII